MWHRFIYAGVGAVLITVTMFLGMSQVAELFGQRDPARYFRIVDFIPSSGERRLPNLVRPTVAPERARVDQQTTDRAIIDAPPSFEGAPEQASPTPRSLSLEPPAAGVDGE